MNGQHFNNTITNSVNGNTSDPSSPKHPGSLSSQSSRDTSPSRLINEYNHMNAGKSNPYVTHSSPSHKFSGHIYENTNPVQIRNSDHSYQGLNQYSELNKSINQTSTKSADISNFKSGEQDLIRNSNLNYNTKQFKQVELTSNYYKEDQIVHNNFAKVENISNEDNIRHSSGQNSNIVTSSSTAFKTSEANPLFKTNYSSNIQVQQSYPIVGANTVKSDQPISSGPPRTNALGIIPYSTDVNTYASEMHSNTRTISTNRTIENNSYPFQQPVVSSQPNVYNSIPSSGYVSGYNQINPNYQSNPYVQSISSSHSNLSNPQTTGYNNTPSMTSPINPPNATNQTRWPNTYNHYQQNQPPQYSQHAQYNQQVNSAQIFAQQKPAPLQSPTRPPLSMSTNVDPVSKNIYPPTNQYGPPTYNSPSNYSSGYPPYQQNAAVNYMANAGYNNYGNDISAQMSNLKVTQSSFNQLWGRDAIDLLKTRDILPPGKVELPSIPVPQEFSEQANCSPELFRCTLTKIPESKSLLDKCRLPLGVLIHPFKDLDQLSVVQCSVIVRCKICRNYINPFVQFIDTKRWKCNLCFRVNDIPEEFNFDPATNTYGDPTRRPEVKSATIEFIAPSEYMVRPPQPATYVFLFDVSRFACESGYLAVACDTLLSNLRSLPGDSRTAVAIITYDSSVHFYSLGEEQSIPHQLIVVDVEDVFVPSPEGLLVNLGESFSLIRELLLELPEKFKESYDTGCALGAALQAAYKLLAHTGGRVTVFQSCLANIGPGALSSREDPNERNSETVPAQLVNPSTDFYKKLALDCSGQQIAVDLFIVNSQYVDLATISGISQFSGGCMYLFPLFNFKNSQHVESLQRSFQRYLTRKIGFESVMRIRCTKGISIHTFHGNFFLRATDLLSLPNVNPDAGFGMQISIDENLNDLNNVCLQAALLYTSSTGERRIRVHTICLPVASNMSDVLHSADQQCITGLLAKMAVDRSQHSSLSDAREAFMNVITDVLSAYKITQSSNPGTLLAPFSLRLLPLYILSLLKYIAFRVGQCTRLDDRVFAMCQMKTLPLSMLMLTVYPDLYAIHNIEDYPSITKNNKEVPQPSKIQLSAERVDSTGIYLMDDGETIIIYVGHSINSHLAKNIFNVPSFSSINPVMAELPELETSLSEKINNFISYLQNEKAIHPIVQIIRDDSAERQKFLSRLIEDKTESGHSYYEFLQRVKQLVK